MYLPASRGPLSEKLFAVLRGEAAHRSDLPRAPARDADPEDADPIVDDDLQLALYACYQLHYSGFDEVDDRYEWEPDILGFRAVLEERFERAVRAVAGCPPETPAERVPAILTRLIAEQGGPSLSQFIQRRASLEQFREFVMHRSLYHLHEADPHTFAIPRLTGRPKAALVEIQLDEYGGGQLSRMHAELFRGMMEALGLDSMPGAYLGAAPAITLATNNLMSMFGLHRRLRGALLGQLAVFEMTSSLPNRRYGTGLRRLGNFPPAATRFFDEHVEADAVHEQIAAYDMCAAFCAAEPDQTGTVLFGAAAWLAVDRLFAEQVLGDWDGGGSSLRAEETRAEQTAVSAR